MSLEWLEYFAMTYDYECQPYVQCLKPHCAWTSIEELNMRQAYEAMYEHYKTSHTGPIEDRL